MNRFVSSDAIGWRLLRLASVVVTGFVGIQVMAEILGRHCTQSLDVAVTIGAPTGIGLSAATLSHARHRRWQRTMAVGLMVIAGSFVACSVADDNLLGAIDRGKQKYTMNDMRAIGRAIEAGHPVQGRVDAWGTKYLVQQVGSSYTIVSFGDCGEPDVSPGTKYASGATNLFKDDIVFADGHFVRYPAGTTP